MREVPSQEGDVIPVDEFSAKVKMDSEKMVRVRFKFIGVYIDQVVYDGKVYRVESDEYVEIHNMGRNPKDLGGWVPRDISEGYPSFTFPRKFILEPEASVRVYTNEIHPESGGLSFGFRKAIWNNKHSDVAVLYDREGYEVSSKSY